LHLFRAHQPPINQSEVTAVVNVVGSAVVLTVSAVVPLVIARATLALLISLMALGRGQD
jgi:hypothetical protein